MFFIHEYIDSVYALTSQGDKVPDQAGPVKNNNKNNSHERSPGILEDLYYFSSLYFLNCMMVSLMLKSTNSHNLFVCGCAHARDYLRLHLLDFTAHHKLVQA